MLSRRDGDGEKLFGIFFVRGKIARELSAGVFEELISSLDEFLSVRRMPELIASAEGS